MSRFGGPRSSARVPMKLVLAEGRGLMCRQRWLAARPRTWLANGGVTKTTARSTSSSFNRSRAAALRSEDTVTTNGDEWRADAQGERLVDYEREDWPQL